jgi:hypothetical protein
MTTEITTTNTVSGRYDPALDEAYALSVLTPPADRLWGDEDWRDHRNSQEDFLNGCKHFIQTQAGKFGRLISGSKRRFTRIHIVRAAIFAEEADKVDGYLARALERAEITVASNASDPQQARNAAVLRLLSSSDDDVFSSPSEVSRCSQAMSGLMLIAKSAGLEIKFTSTEALYELVADYSREQLCEVYKSDRRATEAADDEAPATLEREPAASDIIPPIPQGSDGDQVHESAPQEPNDPLEDLHLFAEIDAPNGRYAAAQFILVGHRIGNRVRLYGPVAKSMLDDLI